MTHIGISLDDDDPDGAYRIPRRNANVGGLLDDF